MHVILRNSGLPACVLAALLSYTTVASAHAISTTSSLFKETMAQGAKGANAAQIRQKADSAAALAHSAQIKGLKAAQIGQEADRYVQNGYGVFVGQAGERYAGEIRGGQRNGYGIDTYPSGDRYEGKEVNNQKSGYGVYLYANGDRYEGEFASDRIDGWGVYFHADGSRYKGEFADGKANGPGFLIDTNGGAHMGIWRADTLIGLLPAASHASAPAQPSASVGPAPSVITPSQPPSRKRKPERTPFSAMTDDYGKAQQSSDLKKAYSYVGHTYIVSRFMVNLCQRPRLVADKTCSFLFSFSPHPVTILKVMRYSTAIDSRIVAKVRFGSDREGYIGFGFGGQYMLENAIDSALDDKTSEHCTAVFNSLYIGMAKRDVIKDIGDYRCVQVNTTITQSDVDEQWVCGSNRYSYFDNGTLTGIQR